MTAVGSVAAVDIGAAGGRVVLGHVGPEGLALEELRRFPNGVVRTIDGLHWPVLVLFRELVAGLAEAARSDSSLVSVGIDTWAVDYALMRGGRMLCTPYAYRDERNAAGVSAVHAIVPPKQLYQRNGLQHLLFNTVFQLTADRTAGMLDLADAFLLLPDLFSYWLTGVTAAERTNASTTGLLDPRTGDWDLELAERLHLPEHIFAPLVDPGTSLGLVRSEVTGSTLDGVAVTAVGSHDTASAVVAVPATVDDFAYVSCGTWSLVGLELDSPVMTEEARLAGFTNEGGVERRIRFLHNVMGLWLLNESMRHWESTGAAVPLAQLLAEAAAARSDVPVFDADDPVFLAPGDMPARILGWFAARDLPAPRGRGELVRSILASLAQAHARSVSIAATLSGRQPRVIHMVGGGSRSELLCQLTADAAGLPVLAGPAEATAIGNILVQARTHGLLRGSLEALRSIVVTALPPVTYLPRP